MPRIAYSVTALCSDRASADAYIAWLLGGHAAAVIAGGAQSAVIVRLDAAGDRFPVEVRYEFADRAAYDRYLAEVAPALRAEGLAAFPPAGGVRFERRTGEIV